MAISSKLRALNARQTIFVEKYFEHGDADRAAIQAGYSIGKGQGEKIVTNSRKISWAINAARKGKTGA